MLSTSNSESSEVEDDSIDVVELSDDVHDDDVSDVTYLSSLGGDAVVSFVEIIFGALFSEEITSIVTFFGRQQGKRPFFGTPTHDLVLQFFDHRNRGQRSDRQQLERALKIAFKQAYDRLLKRNNKLNAIRTTPVARRIHQLSHNFIFCTFKQF
ncbi:hypothetical protein SprV_0501836600 [Sparganum proliferum]